MSLTSNFSKMSLTPNFSGLRSTPILNDPYEAELSSANIDWKETPVAHVFKLEVPGVTPRDFKPRYMTY